MYDDNPIAFKPILILTSARAAKDANKVAVNALLEIGNTKIDLTYTY